MNRAITIQTDHETLEALEHLARSSHLPADELAGQALREFIRRGGRTLEQERELPRAGRLEDYRSAFWQEDDEGPDAFLEYLRRERQLSVETDHDQRLT